MKDSTSLSLPFQKILVMPNMDDVWLSVMHSATDPRTAGGPLASPPANAEREADSCSLPWTLFTVLPQTHNTGTEFQVFINTFPQWALISLTTTETLDFFTYEEKSTK